MSRLFVGCMARVVGAMETGDAGITGSEARVTGGPGEFLGWGGGTYEWQADLTSGPYCGTEIVAHGYELEPILPDGHRAGDYSLSDLLDRCKAGEGIPA